MRKMTLLLYLFFSHLFAFSQTYTLLQDINPGSNSSAAFNSNSTLYFGGQLFFSADDGVHGDELWVYDESGAKLLKDINEGLKGSEIQHMYTINGKIVFTADTEANGTEWWTTDGTEEGTVLLVDINAGDGDGVFASYFTPDEGFAIYNNELYFAGNNGNDYELWKTDGTSQGTKLVKNIVSFGQSFPNSYAIFKGELYFSCREGLWKTDGTNTGTVLINDEDPEDIFGFEPNYLFATDNHLLMIQGNNLWVSDGTKNGTKKIYDFEHVNLNWAGPRFTMVNGNILFPADDGVTGDELWKTDGTAQGTQLVKDVWTGSDGYAPQNTVIFKNKLFYKGDDGESDIELFVSDGTESGTFLYYEFSEFGSGFSLPTEIVADSNYIYMNAGKSFSKQLWITDGVKENTFEIRINPTGESRPNSFYLFDGKLFCFATTGEYGFEPYIVDLNSQLTDDDNDGYTSDVDCDDDNPNINPGQTEEPYNGLDDDCNSATLDDDLDQDGFLIADDCDDNNPNINPDQTEEPYNGLDDDCNSATLDDDLDQDGFLLVDDCNDNNPNINPNATEIPNNGIDEDCDGMDLLSATHEIANTIVNIYPNPATNIINIEVDGQINFKANLYDLNGQLIRSTNNKGQILISSLPTGTYLLEIQDINSDQKIVERIIIEK